MLRLQTANFLCRRRLLFPVQERQWLLAVLSARAQLIEDLSPDSYAAVPHPTSRYRQPFLQSLRFRSRHAPPAAASMTRPVYEVLLRCCHPHCRTFRPMSRIQNSSLTWNSERALLTGTTVQRRPVLRSAMIPVLAGAVAVLYLIFLARRYRIRERRKDRLMMKRHAASYSDQAERL
jgi:hypothetical protein